MIALALALTLSGTAIAPPDWLILPLWGKNAPQWAREIGARAARMTQAEYERRQRFAHGPAWYMRVERIKPDSAAVVATLDTLYHVRLDVTIGTGDSLR